MKALKILGGIVVVLVIVIVGGSFLLPDESAAQKSTTMDAAPSVVFAHVNDFEKYNQWSPWAKEDPNMKITYGSTRVGKGASMSWESEKHGAGSMEIVESVPHTSIKTSLDFGPAGNGGGWWTFEEADGGNSTKVTWGMHAPANGVMGRWMGVMISTMVGPMFEQGLADLKTMAEAAPVPVEPADDPDGEVAEESADPA